MNRLQKKCVIATAGIHLLLLTILLVGPAFFNQKPKTDDTQVLDVIPANLIDAAFNSGVKNAQPPAPAPAVVPQPPLPQPAPPAPKAVEPPTPSLSARLADLFKSEPAKPTPEKNPEHKIEVNLTPVVRPVPNSSSQPDNSQIQKAIRNLKKNLSPGTTVDMPGNSSVAYANYASVVKSVYDAAWTLPDTIANDDETTKVSVTIANDGTVISAHIETPSGDASVDASVQRTLDRVTFVAPFPEGAMEKERTYVINFNPRAKRLE